MSYTDKTDDTNVSNNSWNATEEYKNKNGEPKIEDFGYESEYLAKLALEDLLPNSKESQNITISLEENESISVPESECHEPSGEQPPKQVIPKIVFIVPYRNRETQLKAFKTHMKIILEDYPKEDYVIHYIHQMDERVFNRGAMKNIGFLVVKNKYPNDYQNITLVFNDIDTMPVRKNLFYYDTVPGVVKHFFGFTFTLGGIVSIKAADFERVNGFPNFWAWGYEDNLIQKRIESIGMTIDRSIFYNIGHADIIQKNEEITREVNQSEYNRYLRKTTEGIYSIQNLDYTIDNESGFVNVKWFNTEYNPNIKTYRLHDLRAGPMPYDTKFGMMYNNRRLRGGRMRMGI
uniref:Galactosyltransferase C-terminal domain-containing protein n=1 Tax=viral metagenome TaxID=1070528 RepID=A0A6C0HHE1_9ZZZZ